MFIGMLYPTQSKVGWTLHYPSTPIKLYSLEPSLPLSKWQYHSSNFKSKAKNSSLTPHILPFLVHYNLLSLETTTFHPLQDYHPPLIQLSLLRTQLPKYHPFSPLLLYTTLSIHAQSHLISPISSSHWNTHPPPHTSSLTTQYKT